MPDTRPRTAQRRLQTVDDAEVVANRQAVIDHLLRLIRRGVVLINKFTAQLTEHPVSLIGYAPPSTTWLRWVTISVRRGSFSASSQRST